MTTVIAERIDREHEISTAQGVPKLEDGQPLIADAVGHQVVVGQVPQDEPAQQSSQRRVLPSRSRVAVQDLQPKDFPPGRSEVLTPRVGDLADTWLPVTAHRHGLLIVENEEGEEEELSLLTVNRMFRRGIAVKRILEEEESRLQVLPQREAAQQQQQQGATEEVRVADAAAAVANGDEDDDNVEEVHPISVPQGLSKGQTEAFVKKEQEDSALRGESSDFASEHVPKRRKKLVESDGKTPVKLFRRGDCKLLDGGKGHSIQSVMGGNPMDPFPVATEDRKFVKKGECFVAGNAGWAAFAPSYAGANGLIEMFAYDLMPPEQKTFHFFRQLPTSRHKFPLTAYHGKNAVGGYLYLGVYKVPEAPDITFISFNDHPFLTQYTFVEQRARVHGQRAEQQFYENKTVPPYTVTDYTRGDYADTLEAAKAVEQTKTVRDDMGTDDDGNQLNFAGYGKLHRNQLINNDDKVALLRKFRTENLLHAYAYVEWVGYDENLYMALVKAGAQASKNGVGKHVSQDPADLAML